MGGQLQLLSGEVQLGSVLPEAAASIRLHCAVDSHVSRPTQQAPAGAGDPGVGQLPVWT